MNFHEFPKCSNNISNKYHEQRQQTTQFGPKTLRMAYCATGSSLTAVSHFRKSLKVVRGSFGPPSEYSSSLDLLCKSRELIPQKKLHEAELDSTSKQQTKMLSVHIKFEYQLVMRFFPNETNYSESRSGTPLSLESTHDVPKSIR